MNIRYKLKKETKNIFLGIIIGLLIPLISLLFLYKFHYIKYDNLVGYNSFIFPKIFALCTMINMLVFYIFMNKLNKVSVAKGIVIATFIYCICVLLYKLI